MVIRLFCYMQIAKNIRREKGKENIITIFVCNSTHIKLSMLVRLIQSKEMKKKIPIAASCLLTNWLANSILDGFPAVLKFGFLFSHDNPKQDCSGFASNLQKWIPLPNGPGSESGRLGKIMWDHDGPTTAPRPPCRWANSATNGRAGRTIGRWKEAN